MSTIIYPVSFNGNSIDAISGVQVYSVNPFGSTRSLNLFQLARRSARKLSSAFDTARVIYVSIAITGGSRDNHDKILDQVLQILQSQEGTLQIPQSGGTRQYTATYAGKTLNNPSVGQSGQSAPQGGYGDWTLAFECSDSFGYDPAYTLILNLANRTSNPNTWNYTQGGGADEQVPIIQIYYTGGAVGVGTVSIGNNSTGQVCTVSSRTWAVGETLTVQSPGTVQVNGVDVSFTGAIPTFGLGLQTITYSDTFASTRTYQLFAYVFNRYP